MLRPLVIFNRLTPLGLIQAELALQQPLDSNHELRGVSEEINVFQPVMELRFEEATAGMYSPSVTLKHVCMALRHAKIRRINLDRVLA